MARSILLFAVAALSLAACKKAEDTQSPEDILRAGQWRRVSAKSTLRGTTTDAFALLPTCVKDNRLQFNTNHTGTEYRNDRCNAGDPESSPFEWEVYNAGRNIRIYNVPEIFGGQPINAQITNLTEGQLALRYTQYKQDPKTQQTDTTTVVDVFSR